MTDQRMKALDAVWLMMESADTPMHVGVLAIFSKPDKAPRNYLSALAEHMRTHQQPVAPWNQRLVEHGVHALAPHLEEDPGFDLDYHFRHSALPDPGGERELGVMVSRLHSNALDRKRPLWEFHLIEGLARGRFAFYIKIHHALVKNINAIPLLMSWLSPSARRRTLPPLWSVPPGGGSEERDPIAETLRATLSHPVASMAAVGKAATGLLGSILGQRGPSSFSVPWGVPRSTLNRKINRQRRFATQQFELAHIEKLARQTDSTVNETLTYLCSSSLRRFFKEYNALPDTSLIGVIPVALQERADHLPGNAIAGIRVPLATDVGDPLARLAAIKKAMRTVRKDRESLPDESVTSYVLMRAAPIYASQVPTLGRLVPPLYNLAVSNTAGADKHLYCHGARLEAVYPVSSLMQFNALSIDCVSYAGTLNIGFTGARDTLPHLQRLAVYFGQSLHDLEMLVGELAEVS